MLRTVSAMALAVVVSAGCSGGAHDDLVRAAETWARTKKTCNAYNYEIDDASVFGFWASTTIEIAGDQPVLRAYMAGGVSDTDGSRTTTTAWTETAPDVGSHAEGRPARTMEQLYGDCDRNVLTQDPAKNDVYFAADARGVLQACWYVPHGCQDDCTTGVTLARFGCMDIL